jgi:hypothetical protein
MFLRILFFLMPVLCMGQQCPQDTCSLSNPAGNLLWSTGVPLDDECPPLCDIANRYNCWLVEGYPFEGMMQFACSDTNPTMVGLRILEDCHFVLWDTCMFLSYPDDVLNTHVMFAELPMNSQACIYWDSNATDSVVFYCKPTGLQHTLYDTPIFDLDSCTPPLAVLEPMPMSRTYRSLTELMMGRNPEETPYSETVPGTIYVESGTKRKVLR